MGVPIFCETFFEKSHLRLPEYQGQYLRILKKRKLNQCLHFIFYLFIGNFIKHFISLIQL